MWEPGSCIEISEPQNNCLQNWERFIFRIIIERDGEWYSIVHLATWIFPNLPRSDTVAENVLIFRNSPAGECHGENNQNDPLASWRAQGRGIKTLPFLPCGYGMYKKIQFKMSDVWTVSMQKSTFCFVCDMKVECKSWTSTILATHTN